MTDPGFYPGIPRDDYDAIEAMRSSLLRYFGESPKHAMQYKNFPPPPTKDMIIGQALHCVVLDPDSTDSQFVEGLDRENRSNKDKEAHIAFQARHSRAHVLDRKSWEMVQAMAKGIWTNQSVKQLLTGKGANELAVVWDDDIGPTRCKALLDRLTTDVGGYPCILDIKSTKDIRDYAFRREILERKYHVQAALYLRGANKVRPMRRKFYLIPIEKKEPFDCRVLQLEEDAIDQGTREVERYLRINAECVKNDTWPGHGNGWVSLPSYGFDKDDLDG